MNEMNIVEKRYDSIQKIRGIAISAIIISHINPCRNIFDFTYFGAFGVSLFIMISGVLAGFKNTSEFERGGGKLWRRYKKFFPLHIFTFFLAFVLCIKSFMFLESAVKYTGIAVLNILCLQSWVPVQSVYFSYNAVSWYLTLVMFMTVIEPWLNKYRAKIQKKRVIVVLVMSVMVWNLIWCCFSNTYTHWLLYIVPLARIMEFIIGFGVGGVIKRADKKDNIIWDYLYTLCWMSVIILLIMSSFVSCNNLFLTIVWLIPAILIVGLAIYREKNNIGKRIIKFRLLEMIGNLSMELFLTHWVVIRYIEVFFSKAGIVNAGAFLLVCLTGILFAALGAKKIETGLHRL